MQVRRIFTRLILSVIAMLPYHAFADSYCPVTDDGKIRIDECTYSSNDECKLLTGTRGNCAADQLSSPKTAPYCLIAGTMENCESYFNFEACDKDAKSQSGTCIINSNYQAVGK